MRKLALAGSGIISSSLAFGTGSLHHLAGRDRERLLLSAVDLGITHFDTSPYYGFGVAESALSVLRRGPEISIATKVGLYPPGGADQSPMTVRLRKLMGRFDRRFSRAIADLSVARAHTSLTGSLRRLARDRVDLLLLHEPDFRLFKSEEWLRWLEEQRDRVRAVGIAGEVQHVLPFVERASDFAAIIQTRDSVTRREAEPLRRTERMPHITFGHLAARGGGTASEAIRKAFQMFPNTVLLVSTRSADHLRQLAAAA
jgi:aryl-alcohol dehydrogenase-like predicted oxidoreductase